MSRLKKYAQQAAAFALPLVAVAIALAYLGYGVSECRSLCSTYGEAWHASENAALPPAADGCTCVDSSGALRRRTR